MARWRAEEQPRDGNTELGVEGTSNSEREERGGGAELLGHSHQELGYHALPHNLMCALRREERGHRVGTAWVLASLLKRHAKRQQIRIRVPAAAGHWPQTSLLPGPAVGPC